MLKSLIPILFGVATSLLGCGNTNKTATPLVTVEASTNADTEKRSISAELKANGHLPIEAQVALYLKLKEENPTAYNFDNEDELTMYGYGFLWNNQTDEALEIFKLIASQFPNSSNAYDSLGEAYMKKGNMELSLKNYEKSLAMNPDNFNAEDQIERIKFPNKTPITPQEKFVKVYSVEDYKADLDQLGHKLIEINPNALKFISKEDFYKINKIEGTDYANPRNLAAGTVRQLDPQMASNRKLNLYFYSLGKNNLPVQPETQKETLKLLKYHLT